MPMIRRWLSIQILLCFVLPTATASPIEPVDLRELPCHWYGGDPANPHYAGLQRARVFADRVAIYSIAANQAYQNDPEVVEDIPLPKNEEWEELSIEGAIEKKIGFAAKSWKRKRSDGRSELLISFRGTDDFWRDFFKGNLVFSKYMFGRTQFDAALEYTTKAEQAVKLNAADYDLVLVGHSLGGGLAEYAQRMFPGSKAITFDTSPNQGRLYSLFSKKGPKDSIRVYERGEVLSYLRYIMSPDFSFDETPDAPGTRAIWMDFYSDDIVSGHSMRDLSVSLLKVAASTGSTPSKNVLKQLMERPRSTPPKASTCHGNPESGVTESVSKT